MRDILQKQGASEESLIKSFAACGKITGDTEKGFIRLLEKSIDRGHLKVISFLSGLLSDAMKDDNFPWAWTSTVFDILSDRNRVSCSDRDHKPIWKHPGVPCLLESLMQLVSAEKTKYLVYNNRWAGFDYRCWKEAADHAMKLADMAFPELSSDPLYADLRLEDMKTNIQSRASHAYYVSEGEAKSCENYYEINGDPVGSGWKPLPGRFQVGWAIALKHLNFVKELKSTMNETQCTLVFERYLASQ